MQASKVYGDWEVGPILKVNFVILIVVFIGISLANPGKWGIVLVAFLFFCLMFAYMIATRTRTKVLIYQDFFTYRTVFRGKDVYYAEIDNIQEFMEYISRANDNGRTQVFYFDFYNEAGERLVRIPYTLIGNRQTKREFLRDIHRNNPNLVLGEGIYQIAENIEKVERNTTEILSGMKRAALRPENKKSTLVLATIAGIAVLIPVGLIVIFLTRN